MAKRVGVGLVVALLGLGVGGCGDLGDAISGGLSARDCHPDPKTVAALRREPVLTRTPPGATLGSVAETVSCGWDSAGSPPQLGIVEREVTGAGASDEVTRFYADLARSGGWKEYDQATRNEAFGPDNHVFDASKADGTHCTWGLQVLSTATGTYQVQITYTPRDLRPTCI
ncbi:hypothetical protein [Micromonospora sp. NPDC003776]